MSDVIHITDEGELDDLLATTGDVVVKFTAPAWCIPCRQFLPHYEKAATALPHITFVSVDVDKADWAMSRWGIQSVPTVTRIRGGRDGNITGVTSRAVVLLIRELTYG